MTAIIGDPELAKRLIAERQATGQDKYDEVWDGVYVMAPMANPEHQIIVTELSTVLVVAIKWSGLGSVSAGGNVSGNETNWTEDYRCPDILVFLRDTSAEERKAHWFGGPDLAVEVVSEGDRAYDKLPFYLKVNTREVLFIDRNPWMLSLYRNISGQMTEIGQATVENQAQLASELVPLAFSLMAADTGRPQIKVRHLKDGTEWLV